MKLGENFHGDPSSIFWESNPGLRYFKEYEGIWNAGDSGGEA